MYPPEGINPFRSSITRWGWLFTTFPSSFPFQVVASSLNSDDLKNRTDTFLINKSYFPFPVISNGPKHETSYGEFITIDISIAERKSTHYSTRIPGISLQQFLALLYILLYFAEKVTRLETSLSLTPSQGSKTFFPQTFASSTNAMGLMRYKHKVEFPT